MFRTLKRLIGIWEPREGVVYKSKSRLKRKDGILVRSIVECFIDGSWQECSFVLKKGKYYVFVPKLKKQFVIEKKYVKVEKKKIGKVGVADVWVSDHMRIDAIVRYIRYRLMVKDPTKMKFEV